MWLVIDIGNSAVKGGLFEGDRLLETFRIPLPDEETPASFETVLQAHLQGRALTRAGLASVVPVMTSRVQASIEQGAGIPVEVLHHRMRLPFTLAYETPHTMGIDRLAAAAGAWTHYGPTDGRTPFPVVALDAGTAVTADVIDREGVFRGGAIGAGPQLVRQALARGTAQLPPVSLTLPETPVGRSTQEALQAGIMYAFIEGTGGILRQIQEVLGTPPLVVATGGWSDLLHAHLKEIDHVDPHLVLHGVRVLMGLNNR